MKEKLDAIRKMPAPKNVKEIESFLGMVGYYGKFIKNLSDKAAPMNYLRKKDVQWSWGPTEQRAFENVIEALLSQEMLVHYDPNIPVVLATDASDYGLGAVIYHTYPDGTEKVIAFASRTLTKSEKNYAQIDKEALGIVYGIEYFNQYLYGKKFTLLTDHQPLVHIFGPKHEMPVIAAKRTHRWAVKLMGYQFDIQYRRTDEFGNADGLSRLPLPNEMPTVMAIKDADEVSRWAQENFDSTAIDIERLITATDKDPVLKQVKHYLATKFPEKVDPHIAHPIY